MGLPLYGRFVRSNPWFEIDDPDDEFEFTEAERAFAGALRERAEAWSVRHAHNWVGRPEDDDSALLVSVSLSDRERRLSLGNFGVHFTGRRVRGDRLHSQLFYLPEQPTGLALEVSGSPDELADRCAEWFEGVLRKPVVLLEWLHEGAVYAARYVFADTAEGLCQSYDKALAPQGQPEALIASGHVRGRGWIQTAGLGAPDRFLHVRGDLAPGTVPGAKREEPSGTRSGAVGVWYG
jgi:hypothetical protein